MAKDKKWIQKANLKEGKDLAEIIIDITNSNSEIEGKVESAECSSQ